jgi:hypothetical protein
MTEEKLQLEIVRLNAWLSEANTEGQFNYMLNHHFLIMAETHWSEPFSLFIRRVAADRIQKFLEMNETLRITGDAALIKCAKSFIARYKAP